jgi:hypothetical protein
MSDLLPIIGSVLTSIPYAILFHLQMQQVYITCFVIRLVIYLSHLIIHRRTPTINDLQTVPFANILIALNTRQLRMNEFTLFLNRNLLFFESSYMLYWSWFIHHQTLQFFVIVVILARLASMFAYKMNTDSKKN